MNRDRVFRSVAFLLVVSCAGLPQVRAGEIVPALGTWEFEIRAPDGQAGKQTVAFIRKDGQRIYGVRKWFNYQIFSLTVDPATRMARLETREHHANGQSTNCQANGRAAASTQACTANQAPQLSPTVRF